MHVIVSTQGNCRWISGIFLDARDAELSLMSLPEQGDVRHALQAVPLTEFPFFILQDRSGFSFLDATEATRVIGTMAAPAPNAEPALFAILSEYRPDVAGRDEMGRLRHVHLDDDQLAELRKSGPLSLAR
jgi:hypothetical protein